MDRPFEKNHPRKKKSGVFAVASIGFVLKGWMDYNETSKKIEHDFSPSTYLCIFRWDNTNNMLSSAIMLDKCGVSVGR